MTDLVPQKVPTLPQEIENFRFDHGRSVDGEIIASELCLSCHPFEDEEPIVDTYLDYAPDCRTCHPSKENPALQGGAPALNPDDLLQASKKVTHDAPYPGFKETVKGLFRGFLETITGTHAPTETSVGTIRETLRTGVSYRLPGKGNSIAARVMASGSATVDQEGTLSFTPDWTVLREAALGFRSDKITIEGGLIAPTTFLGRPRLVGGSASIRPLPEFSADIFLGLPVQTEDPKAMVYGGGIQALKSDRNGSLTAGLDLLGNIRGLPRFAFNTAGLFSELKGRVRGAFLNRTYFDPKNVFMPFQQTETAARLSLGPLNLSAEHVFAPASSDDPFSGRFTAPRQTLKTDVGVRVPYVTVNYGFSKGTYLLYRHEAVVIFDIGRNLDLSVFAEHQKQLFVTEPMATTRFGGDLTMTFRDFQTRFGYLERRGDPFPIFNGIENQGRWLTLSGSYQIADRVTVSGQMVVDVENKFLPTSGQLVVTIPFEKAPAPGEANERFTTAESTFRSIASRDPILGSLVNPAIYPKQVIPATVTMDHKKMLEAGLTCATCHNHIENDGQMALPEKELCVQCHHQREEFSGRKVQIDYDPQKIDISRSFTNFDHRILGHVPAGEIANGTCLMCHSSVASATIATRNDLPQMQTCMVCHTGVNTYLVPRHNLDNECQLCHVSDSGTGKLETRTPYGSFFPQNGAGYFAGLAHGERGTGERAFWLEGHNVVAQSQGEVCYSCHDDPGTSPACNECHDGSTPPATHTADWRKQHPIEWLNGNDSCGECHDVPDVIDEMSLCRECHDDRGVSSKTQHPQDWRYDCRDADPTNYHQLNALGGAEFCFACHEPDYHPEQERKAVGCSSCHDAENLGTCDHD